MKNLNHLKVKIITGYRKDQYYTISAEEAHKAYFLFLNESKKSIFKDPHGNPIAIRGKDIRGIEPDYNAIMGWNPTHSLDSDDWNEIRSKGIDKQIQSALAEATWIAQTSPEKIQLSLSQASEILRLE